MDKRLRFVDCNTGSSKQAPTVAVMVLFDFCCLKANFERFCSFLSNALISGCNRELMNFLAPIGRKMLNYPDDLVLEPNARTFGHTQASDLSEN